MTVVRPLLHVLYRADVTGQDRVPGSGPAILASNHESLVDPFVLGLATPRVVRYTAKAELWRNPAVRVLRPHRPKMGLPKVSVLVGRPIPVEQRKPTIVAANELIGQVEAAVLELRRPYGEPLQVWIEGNGR